MLAAATTVARPMVSLLSSLFMALPHGHVRAGGEHRCHAPQRPQCDQIRTGSHQLTTPAMLPPTGLSVPGHVDRPFEVDVSGTQEGVRHRDVAEIRGGPDARDVLGVQDTGALAEDV